LKNLDPIHTCAWCFASEGSYAVNSYPKVGLFMAQLKHDLGADVFTRAQRAYFQEWSFRHPDTKDFFDVFERVSGRDLSTYRRNLMDGRAQLDWQVVSATSSPLASDNGVFEHGGKKETLEDGEPPGGHGVTKPTKLYGTVVLFGNTGDWDHDAKARMVFTDGTKIERILPAGARWVRFRIDYGSKLAYAVVDPDRENVWDWDRLNDSKVLATGKGAAATLGHRAYAKYSAWMSYLGALWSQVLWGLA